MALRINTNLAALNAHRLLTQTDNLMGKSIERLSSGLRINKAKDDVAGLSIANNLRMEVRGLQVAQLNVTQGNALLQMAEGGATQIESIVERLKELATSAASSNVDQTGRDGLQAEASKLLDEIDRIARDTKYGTTPSTEWTIEHDLPDWIRQRCQVKIRFPFLLHMALLSS